MNFTIKKLAANELGLAKQLLTFFQVDDGLAEPTLPTDSYLVKLLSKDDFHMLVALNHDKLIGGLTAYELPMCKEEVSELFIYEIAVEPLYRKKGAASALINEIKKIGLDRKIEVLYVGTEKDNIAAKKLYKSTGGKENQIAWFVYGE